jgi:hypothetical protein
MAPKELDFFSNSTNWNNGVDWYKAHFKENELVQGEVSPNYSKYHLFPGVPERMHALVPDVKLIYVVREPISRIISHFSHAKGEDTKNRNDEEIFDAGLDNFVKTTSYMRQLDEYVAYFSREKILVVTSEGLKDMRQETLRRIFRFLGVDESFGSESFNQIRHDSSVKVKRNVIGRAFARYQSLRNIEGMIKALVPYRWYPFFARLVGSKFDRLSLSQAQQSQVRQLLFEDFQRLKEFSGHEFREWNWPSPDL